MFAHVAADAVLLIHFGFIVFVLLGGLLVLRVPALAWLHLPAIAWAVFVEATARICPLTYVENALRAKAGLAGYRGDFLSHYLLASTIARRRATASPSSTDRSSRRRSMR